MIQEMRKTLEGLHVLRLCLPMKERAELRQLGQQLDRYTKTIDDFYDLLGPSHWIFHEQMNIEELAELVETHIGDAPGAQAALINFYQADGRLEFLLRGLNWHEAWLARLPLMELALADYRAGRHYAVVQVLLSVMDGFVNDLHPGNRKGLHARTSEDLDAWNSVVGHHRGLAAAHSTFKRTFKGRHDEPTLELYRNGIEHGMLTNYNNEVVSTKAWNRLFAVSDWARSLVNFGIEAQKPPEPTLKESFVAFAQARKKSKAAQIFQGYTLTPEDQEFAAHPVTRASEAFLEAWTQRRYGHIPPLLAKVAQVTASQAKDAYSLMPLDHFQVTRLDHRAACRCIATVTLTIEGIEYRPNMQWLHEAPDGELAVPGFEDGQWRLVAHGPTHLARNE